MPARRARLAITAIVVVVLLAVAGYGLRGLWDKAQFASETCTVGSYDLDTGQASVASTMVGAVTRYPKALPYRATVLVLAAALQESKLTNIPAGEGDRDSVGVLQQRPSQGWGNGKASVLTDVGEATREFLVALVKVDGWQQMTLAEAIQAVQISADGGAYAQHEGEATALAAALSGRKPAAITCDFTAPTQVATPRVVAAQLSKQLGIDTPQATGDSVRVPGAGWQTAAWFVANADRLGIDEVRYRGQHWTRRDGWSASNASEAMVVARMHSTN